MNDGGFADNSGQFDVRITASVPEPAPRRGAILVATGFASVITLLLLVTSAADIEPALSQYFAARSLPEAHGRNVVNVILVDFRALDTLGEITVVMLSLLAALPLLRALRAPEGAGTPPP